MADLPVECHLHDCMIGGGHFRSLQERLAPQQVAATWSPTYLELLGALARGLSAI